MATDKEGQTNVSGLEKHLSHDSPQAAMKEILLEFPFTLARVK